MLRLKVDNYALMEKKMRKFEKLNNIEVKDETEKAMEIKKSKMQFLKKD